MIPYVPEPFIDRSVQYPGRRYITRPDSTVELCQISRSHEGQNAEGAIYAEGTPLNAQSFNDEMTKVKDSFDSISTDLQAKQPTLTPGSGIVIQNNVISATGGGGAAAYLSGLADVGLYAPTSGEVLLFDGSQGKWINGDIVTGKKSGAVVAFGDGAGNLPVIDLNVEIKATQSGTGDPSPTNVRPISGYTGLNLTRAGINIWDEETLLGYFDNTGAWNTSNTILSSKNAIPVSPNTTYYIKGQSGVNMYVTYWTKRVNSGESHQDSFISRSANVSNSVITTPANCYALHFNIASAYGTTYQNDISINNPSTDTAYHAHTITTYPVTWQTEAGTVYGGTDNPVTGELVSDFASLDMINATWRLQSINSHGIANFYTILSDRKNTPTDMCDRFARQTTTISDTTTEGFLASYSSGTTTLYIRINSDRASTVEAFTTWLGNNPTTFIYPLAQPQTYQLTPTEIETLQGNNTIFADCGDILNLEYYRDEAKKIIDLFQFDESLKDWTAQNFAPLYTDVVGTLLAGETYLILNSPKIFTTSTIDIYTDTFGVAPYAIEVQNGNVRLTFVARASDLNVKVRIT